MTRAHRLTAGRPRIPEKVSVPAAIFPSEPGREEAGWQPALGFEPHETRSATEYRDHDAYVQFTVEFPRPFNLSHPFEMVRAWAKQDFADRRQLPVILALHAPGLAASANPVHIHVVVLPRRLTQLGFGEFDRELPHDKGRRIAYESWVAFRQAWTQDWPSFLIDMPIG